MDPLCLNRDIGAAISGGKRKVLFFISSTRSAAARGRLGLVDETRDPDPFMWWLGIVTTPYS